jgi:integrase
MEPRFGLHRIMKRAHIGHFTVHGLRRSFASILASRHVSYIVIEHCLGHKAKDVTMGYARVSLKAHREAIDIVGNHIMACRGISHTIA